MKLKIESVATEEEKDYNEKVAIILTFSHLAQETLGGMELIERKQGDAIGSKNEEDDHESEMENVEENGQDGMIGRCKEEEKYFSDVECPDMGICGGTCGGKKLGLSKGKVASHCGVESGMRNQRNISKELKKSYKCSRIKSGLKLIIRKQ